MAVKELYASITGNTIPESIDVSESFSDIADNCVIDCTSTDLNIGDAVTVDMGYTDSHGNIFSGVVKAKTRNATSGLTTLDCYSELVKAADYFLAAEDPSNPFTRSNIDAYYLIRDLLAEAGITSYTGSVSNFVFTNPTFNLVSISDAVKQVSDIIAWHVWDDENGTVHFEERRPYVMAGDTATHSFTTGNTGNILTTSYERSEENLRNKVVVYGEDPIVATASAISPYLPSGFYKAAVIASPLITSQSQAQDSANYNLELYNRLTLRVEAETLGNHGLHVNDIVSVTEGHTGASGNWFLYKVSHAWGEDGYTTRMVLRQ